MRIKNDNSKDIESSSVKNEAIKAAIIKAAMQVPGKNGSKSLGSKVAAKV